MGGHCTCQLSGDEGVALQSETATVRSGTQPRGRPTSPLHGRRRACPIYTPAGDRLVTQTNEPRCVPSVMPPPAGKEARGFLPEVLHSPSHPDGRTMLTNGLADRARCGKSRRMRSRLPTGGIDPKASMTGERGQPQMARATNAFRSGLLRADGQIVVSLADGAGGQELIRLSDPATGRLPEGPRRTTPAGLYARSPSAPTAAASRPGVIRTIAILAS